MVNAEKLRIVYNHEDSSHNEKNLKFAQKLIELRKRQIKEKEKQHGKSESVQAL